VKDFARVEIRASKAVVRVSIGIRASKAVVRVVEVRAELRVETRTDRVEDKAVVDIPAVRFLVR
jgi:hypothetical protein